MEATIQTLLFWVFSVIGIAGAIGLIFNRNPVYSALSLILNFFSLAGLYLSLNMEFLAAIQILVYAGAIMVLFLFVIMLLNLSDEQGVLAFDTKRAASFLIGLALLGEMLYVCRDFANESAVGPYSFGKVETVGQLLMTEFLFPFEMISIVLIAALMGAIVVAKKHSYL